MATDVDVQFFSHLNGLTLSNNWGDLIRLLDKALVTGFDFTQITAASIDTQGDVHITLYAAHKAMLLQVVELTGFTPESFNQKYRIKGIPSTTELILKPHTVITETTISTVGLGKLAPLGYEIIFRDTNDVKRVYRAKNPRAEHPFIRVDESLASGTGAYDSTYAKYAMVGLLEHMDHIDDFENPEVLQLPFNPNNPKQNWNISGSGNTVVRGWSRWTWARSNNLHQSWTDALSPTNANRNFTLVGDRDAFYLQMPVGTTAWNKRIYGAGLYNSCLDLSVIPNWFLMSRISTANANTNYTSNETYGSPLTTSETTARFLIPTYDVATRMKSNTYAAPILPDYRTGESDLFGGGSFGALEVPFNDGQNILRGTLKHVVYNGKNLGAPNTTQMHVQENSMYVQDSMWVTGANIAGSILYYLGELE